MTSVLDLIEKFDREKIRRLHESVVLMQQHSLTLMSALETIPFTESGEVKLPAVRVTPANISELKDVHGEAIVSLMLIAQMQDDFGTYNPPSGFMGEYSLFLEGLNKNIDVHLDVGRAVNVLGDRYEDMMRLALITAGVLVGGSLIVGATGGIFIHKFGKAGAKAAGRGVLRGGRELVKRPGLVFRRILWPLGIVLTAADLRRVILRDARREALNEFEGITAAIEFMKGHPRVNREPSINGSVNRFPKEMMYLERRLQCFVMEDGSTRLEQAIEKARRQSRNLALIAEAQALQSRCVEIRKHSGEMKMQYERLFPITDYFITDPKGEKGNVGFNYRDINDARQRGIQEEDRLPLPKSLMDAVWRRPSANPSYQLSAAADAGSEPLYENPKFVERFAKSEEFEKNRPRDLSDYEDLVYEYGRLLEDGAGLLERLGK